MNRNHFEELEYNLQRHQEQKAAIGKTALIPAKNANRFKKQSLFSKLVSFVTKFF